MRLGWYEEGLSNRHGASFARSDDELTARPAYVDFDGAGAVAASESIPLQEEVRDNFIEHWCERVIQGVNRIAQWTAGDCDREIIS